MLFSADKGGNELNHVFVREESGETRDLTPGEKVKAAFAGWAIDRQHFYVTSNERDSKTFDLYRYAAKDYARTMLFRNDEALIIGAVSPDGRYIALVKPRTSADSDVYLFDTQKPKAKPKLITKHEGNVEHSVYEFTRDSKQLIYSTERAWRIHASVDVRHRERRKSPLIKADWDVVYVTFLGIGALPRLGTNDDARTVVRILDTRNGQEIKLPDLPPGDLTQIRFSRDENEVALLLSSDTSPSDVYTVDLNAQRSARLTQALNPQIKEADLVPSQVVRYKSFDGLEIPSVLYKPKTASADRKVPALVWVHGGPGGQSRTGYSAMIQHLVNHGYAVLAANNRGSQGTARRSITWTTSVTARSICKTSSTASSISPRSIGSMQSASASSADRMAAIWSVRRSRSSRKCSTSASISSA